MADGERRVHDRVAIARPCKLYLPRVGKYLVGSTWNLSFNGALLQLEQAASVTPGDRLFLGIAMKRRQAVLPADEMVEAEVVRLDPAVENRVSVAVRFLDPESTPGSIFNRAA